MEVSLVCRFVVGFALVFASIPKLVASREFARAVADYNLLPRALVRPFAHWLPRLELLAGSALIVGVAVAPFALLVAAMFCVFAAAIGWNLVHLRAIDCGCSGTAVPQAISWSIVGRDILLAGLAIVTALTRPTTLVLPSPWPETAETVAMSDTVALLLVSLFIVVGEMLVVAALRTRRTVARLALIGREE